MKKNEDTVNGALPSETRRSDARSNAAKGGSIEFRPSEDAMVYQFSLRDWSDSGLGILVRNDSKILTYIKVGQIISFKMHKPEGSISENSLEAEIRHISDPEDGRHPEHKIVGLHILQGL